MKELIQLSDNYNRSTNLELDFKDTDRIKKTHISLKFELGLDEILKSVLDERSNERVRVLSGSPGLGKSTFAVFIARVLSKNHPTIIKDLLKKSSKKLNDSFAEFQKSKKTKLLPVFLNGYDGDIEKAFINKLKESLSNFNISSKVKPEKNNALDFYKKVNIELKQKGYGGIFIIYDEFGKYLEKGVHNPTDLNIQFLQNFAEFCDRSKDRQIHLLLITHLSISQYASKLPLNVQQEWAKIEGRFQESPFYDKSTDYYTMISSAFEKNISSTSSVMATKHKKFIASYIKNYKDDSFEDFIDKKNISSLLLNTFPLHPSVLALLPYLSNEVAQNERTLFTFLTRNESYSLKSFLKERFKDEKTLLMPYDLYEYFKNLIGRDVGIGGTYKIQLMVEEALGKIDKNDNVSKQIIGLLALASVIKKSHFAPLTTNFLISAFNQTFSESDIKKSLNVLSKQKVLFLNKQSKQYLFQEGTPVDIDEEINKLKTKTLTSKSLVQVIKRYFKANYIIPKKYNIENGIIRFYRSEFISVEELKSLTEKQTIDFYKEDGVLFYIIPFDFDELTYAKSFIQNIKKPLNLFVLPLKFIECRKDIEELNAVDFLFNDKEIISAGSLVRKELNRHKEILLSSVSNLLKPLTGYGYLDAELVYPKEDSTKSLSHFKDLQRELGDIFHNEYSRYVKFNLEYINRHTVSGAVSLGRKVFVEVLRSHKENSKPDPIESIKGRGADYAIMKTMQRETHFKYKIEDKCYAVNKKSDFFKFFLCDYQKILSDNPEGIVVRDLLNALVAPPYGLRLGIIPLFIALSDSFFKQPVSHYLDDAYVKELDGNHYDLLMKYPHKTKIYYSHVDKNQQLFLDKLKEVFNAKDSSIRSIVEGLIYWRKTIPESTKLSSSLQKSSRKFLIYVDSSREPDKILFENISECFDKEPVTNKTSIKEIESIVLNLKTIKKEIEGTYKKLLLKISSDLSDFLSFIQQSCLNEKELKKENIAIRTQEVFSKIKNYPFSTKTNNFIGRAINFDSSKPKQYFLETIGDVLTGVSPRYWGHKTYDKFDFSLKQAKAEIEISSEVLNSSFKGESVLAFIDKGDNKKSYLKLGFKTEVDERLESSLVKIKTILSTLNEIDQKKIILNLLEVIMKNEKKEDKPEKEIVLGRLDV